MCVVMQPAVPGRTLRIAACLALAWSFAGCGSDGSDGSLYAEGDDEPSGESSSELRARWQPPKTTQTGSYQDGPAWNGGRACAGGLLPGSRARGDSLRAKFGIAKVDGYACRPNTANKSQLSMHGTGRALDIFVTGTKGDTVADYIATHANALGFQLVIWNRTLWKVTAAGGASRAYSGPNPHTDHIHAELTAAAAKTSSGANLPADDGNEEPAAPGADPGGADPGGNADQGGTATGGGSNAACGSDGDCNPGNDGSGEICTGGRCVPGCHTNAQCPGVTTCVSGSCQ
jgi:hypothetical protein